VLDMKRGTVAFAMLLLCGSAAALLPTSASAAPASPQDEWFVGVSNPDFDEVDQGCPTTSNYDSTPNGPDLAVGDNIWGPTCEGIDRGYFQFQLPQLPAGATIQQASVTATEIFMSSCYTRPISLQQTGPIGPATDWNTQPAIGPTLGTHVFAGDRSGCDNGAVAGSFDVTAAIQQAVDNGWTQFTVVLTNDTDSGLGFARFADNPDLEIGYTPAS
jgi:hypothetical protein